MKKGKDGIYNRYIKRVLDFTISLLAIIILSPLLLILTIVGAIAMQGNPFFVQERPGKIDPKTGKEKIFNLIKFRTMSNAKDKDGNLLPDSVRLNGYGRLLRKTSLDELGELFNILVGDMAIIGPRPLLPEYLPYYTKEERHRHDVRPGLTGWAQVNGRSFISWEETFKFDCQYICCISILCDIRIFIKTIKSVIKREGIADATIMRLETDGNIHCEVNNVDLIFRKPLHLEREKKNVHS